MFSNIGSNIQKKGKVKWYSKERGFGLIIDEEDKEYFIHYSELKDIDIDLEENIEVIFNTVERKNKSCAANVELLNNYKNEKKNNRKWNKGNINFSQKIEETPMRILYQVGGDIYKNKIKNNDLILVNEILIENIYNELLSIELSEDDEKNEFTNLIQNNLFLKTTIDKISKFFNFELNSLRFNYYNDSDNWKPLKRYTYIKKKEDINNFTIVICFGSVQEINFKHIKYGNMITIPFENNSLYAFGKEVNKYLKYDISNTDFNYYNDNIDKTTHISLELYGYCNTIE